MSPATVWTELEMSIATGWLRGIPIAGFYEDDAYIDFLFEVPVFSGYLFNPFTGWTQHAGNATAGSELTLAVATPWTELT